MRNKRGWLKIAEAVLGILIVSSVVLVTYNKARDKPDMQEFIYNLQIKILSEIASDEQLREAVLRYSGSSSPQSVIDFVNSELPDNLGFEVRVCPLTEPCQSRSTEVLDRSVFVEERVISINLQSSEFNPKKIRLFVWEK